MILLLIFYSYSAIVMVCTDIVHAVVVVGVTSTLHWRLGNVNPALVAALLIGSIPGGLFGSYLTTRVPMPWLRRILCSVLLATGARMIWACSSLWDSVCTANYKPKTRAKRKVH